MAAYQLRSTEPQAIRAVATFLSQSGQAQGLEFWEQLRRQAPAALTADDRRAEADAGDRGWAKRKRRSGRWRSDSAPETSGRRMILLAAQLALRKGERDAGDRPSLRRVLFADPAHPETSGPAPNATPVEQLRATVLLLSMPSANPVKPAAEPRAFPD